MMLQCKKGLTVLLAVLTMLVSLAAPVSAAEAAGPAVHRAERSKALPPSDMV